MLLKMANNIKQIKAIVLDVDGVLTDGKMIYSDSGESKVFYVRDGKGINLAQVAGLRIAIMTSENSLIIKRRAEKLKIEDAYLGIMNKLRSIKEFCSKYKLNLEEVAFVGDDINDIPALEVVGLPIAVNDAVEEVKNEVKKRGGIISKNNGGNGAVREIIEKILKEMGKWEETVRKDIERQKSE